MFYSYSQIGTSATQNAASAPTPGDRDMIGTANQKTQAKQPTEQEKLVESTRKRMATLIPEGTKQAQSGAVSAMERTVITLKTLIKNPKLPRDLSQEIQEQIKTMEQTGYKYYINDCLSKARAAAFAH